MDNEKIPEVLYKYYPSEKSWDYIFNKWTIRFTPLAEFNDPFEARPTTDFSFKSISDAAYFHFRQTRRNAHSIPRYSGSSFSLYLTETHLQYIDNKLQNQAKEENFRKDFFTSFSREHGSLCLTKSIQNILMWSHYADSHKGFVIGFNTEKIINELLVKDIAHDYSQIRYTKKRPVLTMYYAIEPTSNEAAYRVTQNCFFTKSEIWEYEEEWRIIIRLADRKDKNSVYPVQKIPSRAVNCVIFGMAAPEYSIWQKCREIKTVILANIVIIISFNIFFELILSSFLDVKNI